MLKQNQEQSHEKNKNDNHDYFQCDCENEADMTKQMAKGYEEMSEINLALAEDALATDNQLWSDILD
ncbi:MAG: hypothetical protein IKJ75_06690 [Clostridia bacterium]|nr:hypothetical protein [Clostridia bacterium]